MKYVIFDLETIKTIFTGCFLDVTTNKRREFVIYDSLDDFKLFLKFLKQLREKDYVLVGFNSLSFDAQILEFILKYSDKWIADGWDAKTIAYAIWEEAQRIIRLSPGEKFTDLIPEFKLSHKHIDLFKQKHYDGKAKMGTSLKWLQFSMRFPNVEEMPIHHDADVRKEDIESILSYNWNDVDSTAKFFEKIRFETDLRKDLSDKFGMNLLNASEPRLAKSIFAKFLCEDMNVPYSTLKEMRTFRRAVKFKELIFPYIKFETDELNAVLDKVRESAVNPNAAKFEQIFNFGGIETVMALGGIHACCEPGVYSINDNWKIHDIDVVSFYPNLAIVNDIKPKHLGGVFNKIYKNIFEERRKIPKKDPMNYVYKIILNSTYGLSKEINSYLYDPFFTYSITINGQLSLLMLIEQLVLRVPGLKIYQENTDGATVGYDPIHTELVASICSDWCRTTGLELEEAFYKKMVIRDVNNYMAIKKDFDWDDYVQHILSGKKRADYGKIKHKGTFEIELDFHKNPSFLVINKAAEAYFFGGSDFREFIKNHQDMYDFLAAVRKRQTFQMNLYMLKDSHVGAIPQQKVTRFYVSREGGKLLKEFDDGRVIAVLSDWKVMPLNKVDQEKAVDYPDLDYRFYIKETEKLIHSVEGNVQQLSIW